MKIIPFVKLSGELLETTCDVDVTYFPFDTQNCVIELLAWGHKTDINVTYSTNAIYLDVFSENNVWILQSTKTETSFFVDLPYTKLTITLNRRYAFFILNLFSPVLVIAFLNAVVFLLPAESGERVGYAITCLLALSVYMTYASENLPVSSKPISILTVVLLLYIIISAAMCLEVIIGLKFHLHDDSSPPSHILTQTLCFSLENCKRNRAKSVAALDDVKEKDIENNDIFKDGVVSKCISWKQVGNRFDMLCFIFNNFIMVLLFIIYLGIVIN